MSNPRFGQFAGTCVVESSSSGRTRVVRIFGNRASCVRLVGALTAETHEGWLEANRYLNMELLRDHKKEKLRHLADAA